MNQIEHRPDGLWPGNNYMKVPCSSEWCLKPATFRKNPTKQGWWVRWEYYCDEHGQNVAVEWALKGLE